MTAEPNPAAHQPSSLWIFWNEPNLLEIKMNFMSVFMKPLLPATLIILQLEIIVEEMAWKLFAILIC